MNWACISEKRFQKNVMKTTTKGNHWGYVMCIEGVGRRAGSPCRNLEENEEICNFFYF
jgi:hypothetical protein